MCYRILTYEYSNVFAHRYFSVHDGIEIIIIKMTAQFYCYFCINLKICTIRLDVMHAVDPHM